MTRNNWTVFRILRFNNYVFINTTDNSTINMIQKVGSDEVYKKKKKWKGLSPDNKIICYVCKWLDSWLGNKWRKQCMNMLYPENNNIIILYQNLCDVGFIESENAYCNDLKKTGWMVSWC